jgi:hypothetical protein
MCKLGHGVVSEEPNASLSGRKEQQNVLEFSHDDSPEADKKFGKGSSR